MFSCTNVIKQDLADWSRSQSQALTAPTGGRQEPHCYGRSPETPATGSAERCQKPQATVSRLVWSCLNMPCVPIAQRLNIATLQRIHCLIAWRFDMSLSIPMTSGVGDWCASKRVPKRFHRKALFGSVELLLCAPGPESTMCSWKAKQPKLPTSCPWIVGENI